MLRSERRRVNVESLVIDDLDGKRLLVVTGKGGVGKTTMSAAIALASSRMGLKTLVCEVNAPERVTHLLGKAPVGPELCAIDENLWAVNVRPQEALREYALMLLKFESIYSAVFENRLVRYFLRFVPSLQELVLLGKILFHLKEQRADGSPRFDRIVVDAPATGHAISFFSVPQVLLDTIPAGAMANELRWMRDLLVDRNTTAVVLVSLPEELPVNETLELHAAMTHRLHMHATAIVLNGCIAPRFGPDDLPESLPESMRCVARSHRLRADCTSRAAARLADLQLPLIQVPRIYHVDFGRRAIEEIAEIFLGSKGGT